MIDIVDKLLATYEYGHQYIVGTVKTYVEENNRPAVEEIPKPSDEAEIQR